MWITTLPHPICKWYAFHMNKDTQEPLKPDAPGGDQQAQNQNLVSVDEAEFLFEMAGVPRNERTIRRYCDDQMLNCFKVDTKHGRRWMIDRPSAEKYIIQLQQAQEASGRSRPDLPGRHQLTPAVPGYDHIEEISKSKDDTISFLKEELHAKNVQLERKDAHIDELTKTIAEVNGTAALFGKLAGTLLPRSAAARSDMPRTIREDAEGENSDHGEKHLHV